VQSISEAHILYYDYDYDYDYESTLKKELFYTCFMCNKNNNTKTIIDETIFIDLLI